MREVNLAGLDLNLMPALEALLRRRNVTHAAAEVGLSQPAMSRALARLREIFDDPLLIRVGGGLAPTPAAEALAPKVAAALEGLRGLFRAEPIDPATFKRTFRLAAADAQTILLAPRLAARLEREAPGVDLAFSPIGRDIVARMEQGEVDICFATAATPLPPGVVSDTIAYDRLALVMRRGHPAANRQWTVADYGLYRHATVSFFGDGVSEIDARLGAAGVERRIGLTTPHFMATVAAVAATDLVTTLSAAFAARFAPTLGLILKPPPFDDSLEMTAVSTRLRAADPALQWFRAILGEEAAAEYASRRIAAIGVQTFNRGVERKEARMPIGTSRRGGQSVQDWIMLVCGVMLFVAPWTMGFSDNTAAAFAAWAGGLVIAAMAMAALVQFAEWEDWIALIAGVFMIAAPWALGFSALPYAVWMFVALGLVVALASSSEIWMLHTTEPAAR